MLTIGADPELFVKDAFSGEIKTAIGLLGGTKDSPRPLALGHVQEDNVLAEFNIPPAASFEEFDRSIVTMIDAIGAELKQHNCVLGFDSSHEYNVNYLRGLGNQATEFGCDPDYDAWEGMINPKPGSSKEGLRTASGHLHIGYPDPNPDMTRRIMQAADIVLGLPSVLIDKDRIRRDLYGKAGAFRYKEYGGEYRVLSNFWLTRQDLRRWAFDGMNMAYQIASTGNALEDILKSLGSIERRSVNKIKNVINKYDVLSAKYVVRALGLYIPKG